jgi:hypothetical protein
VVKQWSNSGQTVVKQWSNAVAVAAAEHSKTQQRDPMVTIVSDLTTI